MEILTNVFAVIGFICTFLAVELIVLLLIGKHIGKK